MKILVTSASKHEATAEIARVIGEALRKRGIDVTVAPIGEATVDGFGAFVIGSAVYSGRWLAEAKDFVERNVEDLRSHPVWLFSSGPIGDPADPEEVDPVDARSMILATGACDHRVFAGRLSKAALNISERAIVSAMHTPLGDYRDWDAIRAWASSIALGLHAKSRERWPS